MARKQEVRDRVAELFGKRDAKIADVLIAEKIVLPPKPSMTPSERARWKDGIRRTVNNHRRALMEQWGEQPLPKPGDAAEARAYIAKCQTRIEELDNIVDDPDTKHTARLNAYAEIRQLETLIATTKRVDTGGRRIGKEEEEDPNAPQSKLPFLGVVLDWKNVPPETRAEIEADAARNEQRGRAGAELSSTKVQV